MKIQKVTTLKFGFSDEIVFEGPKSKVLPEFKRLAKTLKTESTKYEGSTAGIEFDLPNKKVASLWWGSSRITYKVIFA